MRRVSRLATLLRHLPQSVNGASSSSSSNSSRGSLFVRSVAASASASPVHFRSPLLGKMVLESREDIVKPAYDDRSYRYLRLNNELHALLVSDPKVEKAAAALDVHVGSFSDPVEYQGLAHFLEHMLFLGTEKYPDEKEYQAFISQHGGETNAFTSMENTQYYFSVTAAHLEGALDRFAQFFISPLFTPSATDREMNAVNSEHQKNVLTDSRRQYQLMRQSANPSHPLSKFATGNLETLQVPGVREALLAFHERYYSANLMRLAVIGRVAHSQAIESLDELQAYVERLFAGVRNTGVPVPTWEVPPWRPQDLKKLYKMVPVKHQHFLSLMFPLPPMHPLFRSKPHRYLSHLIGHEGPGSVFALLKKLGWADSLSAGLGSEWCNGAQFNVSMELTEEGKDRVDDIVDIVFAYINLLKSEPPQERIFREEQEVAEMQFRFREKEPSADTVSRYAGDMHHYPPELTVSGPLLFYEFDPRAIEHVLSFLRPDNMNLQFSSSAFAGEAAAAAADAGVPGAAETSVGPWRTERWYGARYAVEELTPARLARWAASPPRPELHLPAPNPFIATCFDLKPSDVPAGTEQVPRLVADTPTRRVWHLQDRVFLRPKGVVACRINTPVAYESAQAAVMTKLYCMLVEDDLNEFAYSADIAGLKYQLFSVQAGIQLYVNGYDHKLGVLLRAVVHKLAHMTIAPDRFAVVKDDMLRELHNWVHEQPMQHAMYHSLFVLEQKRWHIQDQTRAAETLTLDELRAFVPRLLRAMHLEVLVHGNFTADEALALSEALEDEIRPAALAPGEYFQQSMLRLPPGARYVLAEPVRNADNENSGLSVYFQVGPYNPKQGVLMDLLQRVSSEPLFSQLRTKEQLGYMVHCVYRRSSPQVDSLEVLVQSAVRDPVYLLQRVLDWAAQLERVVQDMPPQSFAAFVQALITLREEKPKSLMEEMRRHWYEISERQYMFDRRQVEIAALGTVTKQDLLALVQSVLTGPEARFVAALEFGCKTPVRPLSAFQPSEVPAEVAESQPVRVTQLSATAIEDVQALKREWGAGLYCSPVKELK